MLLFQTDILPTDIYAKILTFAAVIVAALQAIKMGLDRSGTKIKGRLAVALNLALAIGLVLVTAKPASGSDLYRAVLEAVAAGGIFTMIRSLVTGQPAPDLPVPASPPKG